MTATDRDCRLRRAMVTLRDARRLTQAAAARAAGIPRSVWANIESGKGNPTLKNLRSISLAFGISIADLIGEHELNASTSHCPMCGAHVADGARSIRGLNDIF